MFVEFCPFCNLYPAQYAQFQPFAIKISNIHGSARAFTTYLYYLGLDNYGISVIMGRGAIIEKVKGEEFEFYRLYKILAQTQLSKANLTLIEYIRPHYTNSLICAPPLSTSPRNMRKYLPCAEDNENRPLTLSTSHFVYLF